MNRSNIIQCPPPPSNPKSASDVNNSVRVTIAATDALSGTAVISRTRVRYQAHTTLALINARSVRNKAETICDYITERDFDVICLTETWLSENDDAVIHALTPDGYNFHHLPRPTRQQSRCDVYKPSFHLCSTTPKPSQSFEGPEVVLRHVRVASIVRVFTVHRLPSSGRKFTSFGLFIDEFIRVLEPAATQQTGCVILGDFKVHYSYDRSSDARDLTDLLRETNFQQHVTEITHVGGNIHDLVIKRNTHDCTVSAVSVKTLLTDHHVIQCDLVTVKPRRLKKIGYRKCAAFDNAKFVADLRTSRLLTDPSDCIAGMYLQYKTTIAELINTPLILSPYAPRHPGTSMSCQMRSDNFHERSGGGERCF